MRHRAIALFATSLLLLASPLPAHAAEPQALGIALEGYPYPHPVQFLPLKVDGQDVRMAYMDVPPARRANGRTVLLLHGKNFFGAYWAGTIETLRQAGFRVVVPDQLGFGKSAKPDMPYSFHQLAANTKQLLDTLKIDRVAVVGHSMGGMLATRFALMYPEATTHLVLENPIGLEDYRFKVPYAPTEQLYQNYLNATEESLRAYQKGYYVHWKPEYDTWVQVQYRWTLSGEYPRLAKSAALTEQMIYEQPVIHEFPLVKAPTLLIIGSEDRTAIGRARVRPELRHTLGQYPQLARAAAEAIPNAKLELMPGVGHIPHFEAPERFYQALLGFLKP